MEKSNPSEIKLEINPTPDNIMLVHLFRQHEKLNKQLKETLLTVVASCKQKLFEANKLQKEGCIFCDHPKGPSFVTWAEKEELAKKYRSDISYSGFHCDKPFHAQLFHDSLLPGDFRWSCCDKDLFRKED